MRLTVIFLALINIVYFAWGSWQASQVGYWLPQEDTAYLQTRSERLVLLSELGHKDAAPTAALAVPGDFAGDRQCLIAGPFGNELAAGEMRQRLLALGVDSEVRAGQSGEYDDYWVHIPPLPSADGAMRLLRELQAQRIDSFVINKGELANGISLGLYSSREMVLSVSRRLQDAGYNVAVKPLPRQPEEWWLEIDASAEAVLDASFWDQAVQPFPRLQTLTGACESQTVAGGGGQSGLYLTPGQADDL